MYVYINRCMCTSTDLCVHQQIYVYINYVYINRDEGAPPVANAQKKIFGDILYKELEFRCMYHWYPDNSERGSGYRSVSLHVYSFFFIILFYRSLLQVSLIDLF